MKKRDINRQRSQLKAVENYIYLIYAKTACMLLILLCLLYTGMLTQLEQISYQELISKNIIVITGFMISAANLYIWYALNRFIKNLEKLENIESIRANLLIMVIGQCILMNFISAFLMTLALIKYFQWNQFSLKGLYQGLHRDGQLSVLIITLLVFVFVMIMVFSMYTNGK